MEQIFIMFAEWLDAVPMISSCPFDTAVISFWLHDSLVIATHSASLLVH